MVLGDKLDFVGNLEAAELGLKRIQQESISPEDGKYAKSSDPLRNYLSIQAEWLACVKVQEALLETRVEYGQAKIGNLDEFRNALSSIDTLNISLLEDLVTKHDQLAVLEEIGRFVSEETKALLHPGTTSYDILDTARSMMFMGAWKKVINPQAREVIDKLCNLSEKTMDYLQTGRTHLQDTSPVPLGVTFAGYAARIADRVQRCDADFDNLRGKISGIVGTGASVEMVIGNEVGRNALTFEEEVLKKLGLKPDITSTQIVQKERLADAGHSVVTLAKVLGDFANDIRLLYSSSINELTSGDAKARLGGSSADATKNNPINYENIVGKSKIVESGMPILYDMIKSDLQRDLCNSVEARYQPQQMMVQTYEMLTRLSKSLDQLTIIEDNLSRNLQKVRDKPSEAMVAILRGEGWVHSSYGVGHDFVKEMGKQSQNEKIKLLEVSLRDPEFTKFYTGLPDNKQRILAGELELYVGPSKEKARTNILYARSV